MNTTPKSSEATARTRATNGQTCPLCGYVARPRKCLGGQVLVCPKCSVGWTNPPPPISRADYVEDRVNDSTNYLEHGELHRSFPRRLARFIRHAVGGSCSGRALDVGCNVGYLIEELNKLGFAGEGVEPNVTAVHVAQQHGLNVRLGVLDSNIATGQYSLVTMSHVLEHVDQPLALLQEVRRVLQPGGMVILSQPNYQGLVAQVFPGKWYGWQTSMHYWHFTEHSLRHLFAEAGFRVSAVERNSMHHPWPRLGEGNLRYFARQSALALAARIGASLDRGDQIYIAAQPVAYGETAG